MEHRWSVRTPFTTKVTLYSNDLPFAVCNSRDIGLGGLFIKTGPLTYRKNWILDIDIELNTDFGMERFRLRTSVVFISETGMGLMFLEPSSAMSRAIRRLLLEGVHPKMPMHDLQPGTISRPGLIG
jgi:hypothetical protein